jgi:hypothetical protein
MGGLVMAKNREGLWGGTPEKFQPEQDEEEDRYPGPKTVKRIRMIDWIYACRLALITPFWCIVWFLGGYMASQSHAPNFVVTGIFLLIPLTISAIPLVLIVNFMGYVFDPAQNSLRYPVFLLRRSIPISEIRDANAQTITTKHTSDPGRVVGESRQQTVRSRRHLVNVSGDFGVRVMRFGARYKRDQFLSILRVVAPQCRITRGYWY